MEVLSKSLEETRAAAKEFLAKLPHAVRVVGLRGDLGSGKTTFLQAVARELGVEGRVTSPTFVIEQVYDLSNQQILPNKKRLVHYDCYRLKNAEDLQKLDWQKRVGDKENIIFLEWPEIVKEVLPADTIYLDFKFIDENTREITFHD